MSVSVIPAIIPDDLHDLESNLARLSEQSVLDALGMPARVQIDVMDGAYAPTTSWPFIHNDGFFEDIVKEERGLPLWDRFDFEIDMMVNAPEDHIQDWINAGATSLIIHSASTMKYADIRAVLTEFHIEMGIAFRPSDEIHNELIELADFVQLMGNDKIGYHGVALDSCVIEHAARIRNDYPDKDIAVDIGVNSETARDLVDAGVNKLVSGSYIFDSMDIPNAIMTLKES